MHVIDGLLQQAACLNRLHAESARDKAVRQLMDQDTGKYSTDE